jgi:SAM-dependent methyltransferase
LLRVWAPTSPQRILEVGCGTGIFLDWFSRLNHEVTGLEPSLSMLGVARQRLPSQVVLEEGVAEYLPFEDNSFDTVALITSLEFVEKPSLALQEALRVAKRHVLLGVLNRYSLVTWQRCLECLWKTSIFRYARFFSVFELQHLALENLSGRVPVRWRTCLALPLLSLRYFKFLERSRFFQYQPFGHFIAMRIDLRYPLQTIQQPLLCELPSGMGHARLNACWRDRRAVNWRVGALQEGVLPGCDNHR